MTLQEDQVQQQLQEGIKKAIAKTKKSKENDLCHYLPGDHGGYMHHFTMRKLKQSEPAKLFSLLQQHILNKDTPLALAPKQRAPRGSRGQRDYFSITRSEIERVLALAESAGDDHLIAKFSPKRSLTVLKKELIRNIKAEKVNHDLWQAYAEAIALQQGIAS